MVITSKKKKKEKKKADIKPGPETRLQEPLEKNDCNRDERDIAVIEKKKKIKETKIAPISTQILRNINRLLS